jgi:cobalt-zinc-cadmium efflux system membrane fusion protein
VPQTPLLLVVAFDRLASESLEASLAVRTSLKHIAMRARILQLFRGAVSVLPTLIVLGVLAILAFVGHLTEWKLGEAVKFWRWADFKSGSQTVAGAGESTEKKGTVLDTPQGKSESSGVRFKSVEAVQRSGIKTAPVTKRPMSQSIVANGTIDYDRTRLVHLSTRAPGIVWKVYRRVGEPVHAGEILGLVDAAEVGRAKAEFLQALRSLQLKTENFERQKRAAATGAVPERSLQESEAAAAEARIRLFSAQQALANLGLPIRFEQASNLSDERLTAYLRFLGLPESITKTLDPVTTTANLVPLVAPFDGVVIRSDMVEGEVVSSSPPQFSVADLRRVWVTLDVRQEDMGKVRKSQRIVFRPDGPPGIEAAGTVSWISTDVDDKTRTVRVRADIDNAEGQLRARSFGTGRILVAQQPDAIAIPSIALQWNSSDARVFVQQGDGLSFEPRRVHLGLRDGDYVEVLDGVRPGEIVATIGSHMLSSQLFLSEHDNKD